MSQPGGLGSPHPWRDHDTLRGETGGPASTPAAEVSKLTPETCSGVRESHLMAPGGLNGWEQHECLLGWCGLDFGGRWSSKGEQLGLKRGQRHQSLKPVDSVSTSGTGQPGAGPFPGTLGKIQRNGCVPCLHPETQPSSKGWGLPCSCQSLSWARVCVWEPGGEGLVQRRQHGPDLCPKPCCPDSYCGSLPPALGHLPRVR